MCLIGVSKGHEAALREQQGNSVNLLALVSEPTQRGAIYKLI